MIPCLTPTTTTTVAVAHATRNSSRRHRMIRRIPRRSISSMPIRNTIDASTASGMYCRGFVRNNSTIKTMNAVTNCESWLRPPALSTICVFVGLPFTTNVPDKPADRFANDRPTRSVFSLNSSLYLAAYALEVAAL